MRTSACPVAGWPWRMQRRTHGSSSPNTRPIWTVCCPMPNPINFDHPRKRPVTDLRRWLFVGNLLDGKGVRLLLEAFAKCHDADPSLTLTFVGEGPLAQALADRAAELGVANVVTFTGPLPPLDV